MSWNARLIYFNKSVSSTASTRWSWLLAVASIGIPVGK